MNPGFLTSLTLLNLMFQLDIEDEGVRKGASIDPAKTSSGTESGGGLKICRHRFLNDYYLWQP